VNPADRTTIGRTAVSVTTLGLGAAPIGGLYTPVDADAAHATVHAALRGGVAYVDVAPLYGLGLAEQLLGTALQGVPRESYTLSSKVGRLIVEDDASSSSWAGAKGKRAVFDYSRDAVLRSLEESLHRLGTDRLDIVYIHDPDDHHEEAVGTAYPALAELRSEGVIGAVGVGMNNVAPLAAFVVETDIDVILCAGRYTLLDRSAVEDLFPKCLERGVSVVMGGVFNSGILADPYAADPYYDYQPASDTVVARARRLAELCAEHSTPLRAAALQFPLRHDAVTSVLVGVRSPEEVTDDLEMATFPVPDSLWTALAATDLTPPRRSTTC
jgi:D-threo-aldose 1-dehydrogenase